MTEDTLSLLQTLIRAARVLLAYAVFTVLLLLMLSNWVMPYFAVLKPQLLLVFVYYWALYRPTLLPPAVIFIAGLVLDAFNPVFPIGTHAASYLLIAAQVRARRRFLMGQSFLVVWAGFALAVLFDMLFKWLTLNLLTAHDTALSLAALNGFVTLLLFPVLVLLLSLIHRLLPAGRGLVTQ